MRKALRVLAYVLLVVVVAAGGAISWLVVRKPAQRPASTETVERSPARLARGEYLVEHVLDCWGCHADHDWTRFGGPLLPATRGAGASGCLGPDTGQPGRVCFPNITPDRETGIGAWSDGEILRALREGVGRDGRGLFPMMPYLEYRSLSDEDARSVVAYLRSLPPVHHVVERTSIDFPVSVIVKFLPRPLAGPVADPPRGDRVAYGHYLTEIGGCHYCHTPVDEHGAPMAGKDFAGGQEFRGPWGRVISANLTPHVTTGIGRLDRNAFVGLIRSFAAPESQAPVPPGRNTVMPWLAYSGMEEADLDAAYAYLRTVPPIEHPVDPWGGAGAPPGSVPSPSSAPSPPVPDSSPSATP